MASNFSDDKQEPTIRLTRKQLLALETLIYLLTFSNVQSNNTDAPEPTIEVTRRELLAVGVPETLVDLLAFSNVQSNEPALSVDRISPGDQTGTRSAIEMIQTEVKLNDLPDLPFELILSYLSLEDRIKSMAVSRRWHNVIKSFRLKSLCFSKYPSDFINGKSRWIIGEFAQNFIDSTKFEQFFQTFGQSILVNLKHLRLCKLDLNAENTTACFVQILNSFGQLEELDLYNIDFSSELAGEFQVCLNLPMLKSVQLVVVHGIEKLTLDAPRLQNIQFVCYWSSLKMELVHGESVEKLIIDRLGNMEVWKMKNLKYLYCRESSRIDSTLLSTLEQLNEIHLCSMDDVSNLFRYGRSNLKIFLRGYLLNGPSDPAIDALGFQSRRYLRYLIANPSKVAKEIPLCDLLRYSVIEAVTFWMSLRQEIDLLKRFTSLQFIELVEPVQDVDRFLELLKNLKNIAGIDFVGHDHPQELFDLLPDYCAVQSLGIQDEPEDLNFLFELKSLIKLVFLFTIDIDEVSRVSEELPFLLSFEFRYYHNRLNTFKNFKVEIDPSKQFRVSFGREWTKVSDVNTLLQWISDQ